MAGGDAIGADLPRGDEELIELHVIVAMRARNRRAAFEVVVDERPNDGELELALEIDDVIGNAEMLGDAARVVDVVDASSSDAGRGRRSAVAASGAGSRAAS